MQLGAMPEAGYMRARRTRPGTYGLLFFFLGLILFSGHGPFIGLPYFWDELGQFVPAALDILHAGRLVPYSAVPNVHPPGVMLWLALVWKVAGYSIAATRAAMLVLATVGALACFLLAIRLCRGLAGAPAFFAVLAMLVDPLIYTQSMMAQLDMPAMVFTLAGLLFFLEGRHGAAAIACTALTLSKETGILLPAILVVVLWLEPERRKTAALYTIPFIVLAAWLGLLWHSTGYLLGDPGFAHYNVAYALQPVHLAVSLARRVFYLGIADGRWIAAIAIVEGWRRGVFAGPGWRIAGVFAALHVLLVSALGGAELERYLLPVLPLIYIAAAAGWTTYTPLWRNLSAFGLGVALLAGLFINPPYPFPYENNLAMADFVELHRHAAEYLEQAYPDQKIYTAWPLTAALRRPEFGYVHRPLATVETSDFHQSTLAKLGAGQAGVLAVYSRTWEPSWGVLRIAWVRRFLTRYYEYEPQMDAQQAHDLLGVSQVARWTRRGQWITIYAKDAAPVYPVRR